jgi:hypothetical protein
MRARHHQIDRRLTGVVSWRPPQTRINGTNIRGGRGLRTASQPNIRYRASCIMEEAGTPTLPYQTRHTQRSITDIRRETEKGERQPVILSQATKTVQHCPGIKKHTNTFLGGGEAGEHPMAEHFFSVLAEQAYWRRLSLATLTTFKTRMLVLSKLTRSWQTYII